MAAVPPKSEAITVRSCSRFESAQTLRDQRMFGLGHIMLESGALSAIGNPAAHRLSSYELAAFAACSEVPRHRLAETDECLQSALRVLQQVALRHQTQRSPKHYGRSAARNARTGSVRPRLDLGHVNLASIYDGLDLARAERNVPTGRDQPVDCGVRFRPPRKIALGMVFIGGRVIVHQFLEHVARS